MSRKPRIHYTETDKAVMWNRWQKGDSLEKIAQLFGRTHGSVSAQINEKFIRINELILFYINDICHLQAHRILLLG